MLQKTLAEEAAIAGDEVYDEKMETSIGFDGNTHVERIKAEAKLSHTRVQDEAAKAAAATDLVLELCSEAQNRFIQRLQWYMDGMVQEELEVATEAALELQVALLEEKNSLGEMEEAVALIEFDPVMSEHEAAIEEEEAVLVKHLDAVELEIVEIDSQIQQLPETAPEVAALENELDSLVQEELQIEEVLVNEEQFVISQLALKKDEFYESVAPDFGESPLLQYILR